MPEPNSSPTITMRESFRTWLRISMLSFGGPAAQIAVMHRIIVEEKRWIDEKRFLQCLNFCMLLPGPEAQQLATYIGWLMHGIRGGLMAGLLFILPGFVSILALSYLYVTFEDSVAFGALFFGLNCAVLAIVAEAVQRVSRKVLKNRVLIAIAVIAFALLWTKLLPFPAVIGLAALVGLIGHRFAPKLFEVGKKPAAAEESNSVIAEPMSRLSRAQLAMRSLIVSVVCLTLWFVPISIAWRLSDKDPLFVETSLFFSKAAVVTFGGAYSVLSYVDQQAVEHYGWLEKGEMMDGLGLAETTPGPLIMVVQFVGFLAAWRHGVGLPPLWAGTLCAVLTTWVTFVPCFYWIFLGAPFMERLLAKRWLSAALTAITASVVGVIATLGVKFAATTLFSQTVDPKIGPLLPVWNTIQLDACAVTALAFVLLLRFHRGLAVTMTACVLTGLALRMAMR